MCLIIYTVRELVLISGGCGVHNALGYILPERGNVSLSVAFYQSSMLISVELQSTLYGPSN